MKEINKKENSTTLLLLSSKSLMRPMQAPKGHSTTKASSSTHGALSKEHINDFAREERCRRGRGFKAQESISNEVNAGTLGALNSEDKLWYPWGTQ